MAKSKESFDRRQRERAKKAKANAKRERRLTKDDEDGDTPSEEGSVPGVAQDTVLARLAALHAQFEDEAISFDDFETRREELISQLTVE
jgi:hypothetical protein